MKVRVDLDKLPDCIRIVVTVLDTEKLFSNKLFQSPLDYPSNEMWSLYATGKYTQKELAEMYGVSKQIISYIINNKIWKNNA